MSGPEPPLEPPDWFDRRLDDLFVNQAEIHELSAEQRARQAEREFRAAQLRRRLAEGAAEDQPEVYRYAPAQLLEPGVSEPPRRRRRGRVVIALAVLGAAAIGLSQIGRGSGGSLNGSLLSIGADPATNYGTHTGSTPTPKPAPHATPIGVPAPLSTPSDRYRFIAHQPSSDAPVAYDPCRPIPYVVNLANAPTDATSLIGEAIDRVHRATGLDFEDVGTTDEPVAARRSPFQPARYGDAWAPVVIWWTTPDQLSELAGDVAGIGGSNAVRTTLDGVPTGPEVYVTGSVALDAPQLADIVASSPNGRALERAVILHELAHVVGLGHIDDPTQIMNPSGSGAVTDFAAGDLTGLDRLGRGACIPLL